ncbi:hypothetical protein Hamer_G026817, partial [Homarus americanus]
MAHAAQGDWLQHLAPFQHRLLPHLWMATILPLEHAPQTTMNPIRLDGGSCSVTTRTIRSVYKSCLAFYLLLGKLDRNNSFPTPVLPRSYLSSIVWQQIAQHRAFTFSDDGGWINSMEILHESSVYKDSRQPTRPKDSGCEASSWSSGFSLQ